MTLQYVPTSTYVADVPLVQAVNDALNLGKPLLIKGEAGIGKTSLSRNIADSLGVPYFYWRLRTDSVLEEGLYHFLDNDGEPIVAEGPIWQAFIAETPVVLHIDEIDNVSTDFDEALIQILEGGAFYVPELNQTVIVQSKPFVILTNNQRRRLSPRVLQRCYFYHMPFPSDEMLEQMLVVHFPQSEAELRQAALVLFHRIRSLPGLKKYPTPSELVDWFALVVMNKMTADDLSALEDSRTLPPFPGALLKNEQDLCLLVHLADLR